MQGSGAGGCAESLRFGREWLGATGGKGGEGGAGWVWRAQETRTRQEVADTAALLAVAGADVSGCGEMGGAAAGKVRCRDSRRVQVEEILGEGGEEEELCCAMAHVEAV